MSVFLINVSNIKAGGGIQVSQSICEQLYKFKEHHFIVVLSSFIKDDRITKGDNLEIFHYNVKHCIRTVFFGRDDFLDGLIQEKRIDAVLTVFGPSIWRPRVPHLCGFARAQLLLKDPSDESFSFKKRFLYGIWKWGFKKSSKVFYTENQYISNMLPQLLGNVRVFTVSNYYNQVYDNRKQWKNSVELNFFDGVTALSVSSHYPHKNFEILIDVAKYFLNKYPLFNIRFVLTFSESEMPLPDSVRKYFLFVGKVDVEDCPHLYEQADIMFMPTLMECFTATYPEAMRMGIPIVTTDLEFARGLCGDAACYYSAIDAMAAAEAIYKVANNKEYAQQLILNGKKQLLTYDNYEQRAEKLIGIIEEMGKTKGND